MHVLWYLLAYEYVTLYIITCKTLWYNTSSRGTPGLWQECNGILDTACYFQLSGVTSGVACHKSHSNKCRKNPTKPTLKWLALSSTDRSHGHEGNWGIYTNSSQVADSLTSLEETDNLSHLARIIDICFKTDLTCYLLSLLLPANLLLPLLPVQGARCRHTQV